jgi:ribosomal protein S18
MTTVDFNNILSRPGTINTALTNKIEDIIEAYPYFQTARILHLKGLQKQDSFKFNAALKKTAAYATDRSVLFDFIVSNKSDEVLQSAQSDLENIAKLHKDISQAQNETLKIVKETLNIGKPISFKNEEKHSFDEWLQLENLQPIKRNTPQKDFDLIDAFIKSKPKIKPVKSTGNNEKITESVQENPALMTETLARVYLEQKKYEKALQAYKILSLKYPEKSSFFADRIKAIKFLQKNNKFTS